MAFSECTSLTSIHIPANVKCFCEYTFSECINATSVTYGNIKIEALDSLEWWSVLLLAIGVYFPVPDECIVRDIWELYLKHPESEPLAFFIKNNFSFLFSSLIIENKIDLIQTILQFDNFDKFLTKRNIDRYIIKAMDEEKIEIQVILMDYKNKIGGYTNVDTDMENRFNL